MLAILVETIVLIVLYNGIAANLSLHYKCNRRCRQVDPESLLASQPNQNAELTMGVLSQNNKTESERGKNNILLWPQNTHRGIQKHTHTQKV